MDYQFWLYVIIGVIYFISRLMKKTGNATDIPDHGPEKPPRNAKGSPSTEDTALPRQLTFEELLREITEGKTQRTEEVKPEINAESEYESRVDRKEEKRVLENADYTYKDDAVVTAYEDAKRQAFFRPSLEETMDIRKTDVTYGRFKEFEKAPQKNLLQEYITNLNDADGWKKAVVMSEILQRKF